MAVRLLRYGQDPDLRVHAKEIGEITPSVLRLLDDMQETLRFSSNGMALAAPQVGIPKRVVVIKNGARIYELINPVVKLQEGSCIDIEGCLSFPRVWGEVERAQRVVVEALDRHGKLYQIEGEEQLARALQHELDHLDGILFIDKVIRFVSEDEM